MKKTVILIAAAAILCACNKNVQPEAGYGYIDLGVSADESMGTKAEQKTVSDINKWTVMVGETAYTGPTQAFAAGNYTISASNYATADAALAANNKWGDAFYSGSQNVTVAKGATTNATIACGTAKNARFTVVFDDTFKSICKDGEGTAADDYSFTTRDTRALAFNKTNSGTAKAYYAAGESIGYTLHYTYQGEAKNPIGTITLGAAATEKTITIQGNSNGTITINITYDDTFGTATGESITIDGATGGVVTPSAGN